VGFGTRLGNGCTTGHGICGMARLSPRSIAAVGTFMFSAFCTAALTAPDNKATSKGTSFLRTDKVPELFNRWLGFVVSMIIVLPTLYALHTIFRHRANQKSNDEEVATEAAGSSAPIELGHSHYDENHDSPAIIVGTDIEKQLEVVSSSAESKPPQDQALLTKEDKEAVIAMSKRKLAPAVLASAVFAVGLAVSGMVLPSKVLGFLNLFLFAEGTYDPTLLMVMVAGCIISFVSYQFVKPFGLLSNSHALECPLVAPKFSVPTNRIIDSDLLGGAMCFGIGWGLAGLCPGPAIFLAATGTVPVVCYWWPAFLAGSWVAQSIRR
jgi:uncharacterized protein